MQIGSKSQSSLEYLLVMGIAIFILGAAISYAIYYQVGYNSAGTSQDLQLAAKSIANAVNSLSESAVGSSQQFSFSSPGLNLVSSICNTSVSLSFGGEEASQSLSLYTTGELPVSSGTYVGRVTLVKENGRPEAQISMDLPISYISTSYIYNPSSILYNVSFLDTNGNLVGDVNFTIIIYNDNKMVAEQNESTLSGYYSGSITPSNGGQFPPNSVAEIYVSSLNIISPSCFLPQQLLLIPKGILNFVPLTIKNNQSISTSSPFQQEVVVNSANYQQYEASNLQNVEFFYPNGTIINSWLESGNSNTATSSVYWLKISGIPARSSITVYMGFASKSTNLFNNVNDGEAPQLSSTYGEYDDIGNVMNKGLEYQIYFDPSGACNSGSYQNNVYAAALNNGVTINSCAPMSSSTKPFYTSSIGSSQDVDGTTESNVIMNYQEGYSGGAAYPNPPVSNTGNSWIIKAIGWAEVNSSTTFYVGSDDGIALGYSTSPAGGNGAYWLGGTSNPNNLVSQWHTEGFTTYLGTISSIGTQRIELDYYEDGGGAYTAMWSNNAIDYYSPSAPPNGVMPYVTFGPIEPQITVFVNGVKDGNNGIASGDITNITAFGIHASHIGLMINGSVAVPLGSASLSYQKPLSAGLYNITVFSNQSNLANQTYWEAVANIPKNVKEFVPVFITNLQSSATPNVFQDNLSINSFDYNIFENNTLSNVEFFSPSGSVIPSWLSSGDLAYFNGANSYANLPENYPFGTAGTFTISAWFKTTSDGVVLWNGDLKQVSSGGCYSPIIYVNKNGDLAGGDWVGSQPFNTNHFVANGKWNSVTIVQTSSQQILYLNGIEIATYSGTPQTCSPAYWTIGEGYTNNWANTNNSNFYFNGYISNVQFYNQVFSPSKVALLYDEGVAGSPLNSSGLIAWYLLSGNGNQQNGHNTLSINNITFNGVSSASTSTNYWLKLGSIQPRESYVAFMGFTLPNISLFNKTNDGESPQLSPIYGEYDDGQNVFLSYGDFLNTAGFDGWTPYVTSGSFTPVATPNGIEMTNDTQSEGTHILPPNQLPEEPVIVEYSWNFYGGDSPTDGEILSLFGDTSSVTGAPVVTCGGGNVASADSVMLMVEPVGMNCSGKYLPAILDNVNNKIISTVNNLPSITPQTYTEKLIVSSSTTVEAGVINKSSSISNFSDMNIPISMSGSIPSAFNYPTLMVAAGTGGGYDYNYVRWLIARAYPPNGVMPVQSIGPLNGQVN